jgi:hypothetical protein
LIIGMLVIAGVAGQHAIAEQLRQKHERTWIELGSPSWPIGIVTGAKLASFSIFGSSHKNLKDTKLAILVGAQRCIFIITILAMAVYAGDYSAGTVRRAV